MKVYLAHNYAAREWLAKEVVPKLVEAGHEVTSRWIYDVKGDPMMDANLDLQNIGESDVFVLFTEQYGIMPPGRGKYVEYGYAVALGLPLVLVGKQTEKDCVFFALADFKTEVMEDALEYIESGWVAKETMEDI